MLNQVVVKEQVVMVVMDLELIFLDVQLVHQVMVTVDQSHLIDTLLEAAEVVEQEMDHQVVEALAVTVAAETVDLQVLADHQDNQTLAVVVEEDLTHQQVVVVVVQELLLLNIDIKINLW